MWQTNEQQQKTTARLRLLELKLFTRVKMQKALFVKEVGKPVSAGTRPIPTPGPREVLIKVTSTLRVFPTLTMILYVLMLT
jgi:hypothetical protein